MKKLFIITGEYSGDKHASDVVKSIWAQNPDIKIEAIGGENLLKAGVKLFENHDKMSAVGLSLQIILNHISLGKRVSDYLINEYKPDLVLLIDYGGFKHNFNCLKILEIVEEKHDREGLNLTWQTLDGILKHTSVIKNEKKNGI